MDRAGGGHNVVDVPVGVDPPEWQLGMKTAREDYDDPPCRISRRRAQRRRRTPHWHRILRLSLAG